MRRGSGEGARRNKKAAPRLCLSDVPDLKSLTQNPISHVRGSSPERKAKELVLCSKNQNSPNRNLYGPGHDEDQRGLAKACAEDLEKAQKEKKSLMLDLKRLRETNEEEKRGLAAACAEDLEKAQREKVVLQNEISRLKVWSA